MRPTRSDASQLAFPENSVNASKQGESRSQKKKRKNPLCCFSLERRVPEVSVHALNGIFLYIIFFTVRTNRCDYNMLKRKPKLRNLQMKIQIQNQIC